MSKPRLIASLAIALAALAATAWWAVKTFWLISPAGSPTRMVAYGSVNAPGSEGVSAFMFYMVNDDGHTGVSAPRAVDAAQIEAPVPISVPPPTYTPQARKDKVEGAVLAAVDVDASGNVAGVKLAAVSLSRNLSDGLDESVLNTVRTWKFKPATKKGKPVPARVTVQVDFRLS